MATYDLKMYPSKSAYVYEGSPNSNYHTGEKLILDCDYHPASSSGPSYEDIRAGFIGGWSIPDSAAGKELINNSWIFRILLYGESYQKFMYSELDHDFSETGVTYNNMNMDMFYWRGYIDSIGAEEWIDIDVSEYQEAVVANGIAITFESYNRSASAYAYSSRASEAKKPYLSFKVKDATPYLSVSYSGQTGKYKDPRKEIAISGTWKANTLIRPPSFISGKYVWWTDDNIEHTIDILDWDHGAVLSLSIPPDTFPVGKTISAKVAITIEGGESDEETLDNFSTADAIPTLTPLSPMDEYVDGASAIEFSWKYTISTATTQTKYEMQYNSSGSSEWTTFKSEQTEDEENTSDIWTTTVEANTFPDGEVQWRVRGYNLDGIASEWSSPANIVVVAAPSPPSISSISNNARPLISWQSSNDIAHQVKITRDNEEIIDSGEIAGSEQSYRVKDFMPDGTYVASVRVKNSFEMWSEWDALQFIISTEKPIKPTINVQQITNAVKISSVSGTPTNYVLRDGIPIAKLDDAMEWIDYMSVGPHAYVIRSVNENGAYIDSSPIQIDVKIRRCTLAAVDRPGEIIELWLNRGGTSAFSSNTEFIYGKFQYAGRKLPVFVFSTELKERQCTKSFSLRNQGEIDELKSIIERRQTMIYREKRGEMLFCVIVGFNYTQDQISADFTLQMEEVDFVPRIEYEI